MVIKIIIVTLGAVLRRASMIGTHSLPGMMESDPGSWLIMPRKGSISWRCGWRWEHDPELAVMTKQNVFLHARHSGAQCGAEVAGTEAGGKRSYTLGTALVFCRELLMLMSFQDKYKWHQRNLSLIGGEFCKIPT